MYYIKNRILNITFITGIILVICGCSHANKIENISKIIEVDITNCQTENVFDSHAGLSGNGEYYAKIICDDQVNEKIKDKWLEFPLPEKIKKIMATKQCRDDGCKSLYEKFLIPDIEKGYYYFLDRHNDAKNKNNAGTVSTRGSHKYSLGIYDTSNKTIYYYELDT